MSGERELKNWKINSWNNPRDVEVNKNKMYKEISLFKEYQKYLPHNCWRHPLQPQVFLRYRYFVLHF